MFPGVGLGVLVSEAYQVTDGMFAAAATALADTVKAEDRAAGRLFPPVHELRRVTMHIAEAVVREARDTGVGRAFGDDAIAPAVRRAMWDPAYLPLAPVPARTEAEPAMSVIA